MSTAEQKQKADRRREANRLRKQAVRKEQRRLQKDAQRKRKARQDPILREAEAKQRKVNIVFLDTLKISDVRFDRKGGQLCRQKRKYSTELPILNIDGYLCVSFQIVFRLIVIMCVIVSAPHGY